MNSPVSPYRDRRTALLIAGVLEILLGVGSWLMAALMIWVASKVAAQGAGSTGSMVPGMAVYGIAGLVFVTLGVGSIRARRWARALWLVVSSFWLICGVFTVAVMAWFMPSVLAGTTPAGQQPPPGVQSIIMIAILSFFAVFMIGLPASLLAFYRSPHVKATCEAAGPQPCWTDGCPVPVLGAALWFASMTLTLPWMGWLYGGLYPFFGHFVRGAAGHGLWIASGLLSGIATYGIYRRIHTLWLLGLVLVLVQGISATVTYAVVDPKELFAAMGIEGAALEQIERMGMIRPSYMIGSVAAAILPMVGLLLWARACFPKRSTEPAIPPPQG
jgi:hypothetical protein